MNSPSHNSGNQPIAVPLHLVETIDRLGAVFGQEVGHGPMGRLESLTRIVLEAQVRYLPPPAGECPDMAIPEPLRGILELSFPLTVKPSAKDTKPGLNAQTHIKP